jgi:hypothetical protein
MEGYSRALTVLALLRAACQCFLRCVFLMPLGRTYVRHTLDRLRKITRSRPSNIGLPDIVLIIDNLRVIASTTVKEDEGCSFALCFVPGRGMVFHVDEG